MSITLISATTVASPVSEVTFSAIPQTYTDLYILASVRTALVASAATLNMRYNGSSAANYTILRIRGNGATASFATSSNANQLQVGLVNADNTPGSTFANVETYIPNYTSSVNKSNLSFTAQEENATNAFIEMTKGIRTVTGAITSISLGDYGNPSNIMAGSTFYLYGIKNS